jgi:PKD repeat protein
LFLVPTKSIGVTDMKSFSVLTVAASLLFLSACTMDSQEAPPLAGPSEFATSITVAVTPDVLSQDGASQASITVTARDGGGQAVSGLVVRLETAVNGELMDFGSLSARSIVTGNDGRATAVYTAPAAGTAAADTIVQIVATPVGSDFGNSTPRVAQVRLTPPGVIMPADGLTPRFTFSPTAPSDNIPVIFDASTSTSAANNPIMSCSWNFGDGSSATGYQVSHAYSTPGTYTVRMTVTDGFGRSASTAQSITVGAGTAPTAIFTTSPGSPTAGQVVLFNAAESQAAAGRSIVSYEWNFGEVGAPAGGGVQTSNVYEAAGVYTVTLTVTDDVGRKTTRSQSVSVQ